MKKFGILLLSLCVATPALADFWTNCTNNGGEIVTANSYGNDKGGKCNDPNDPNLSNNCNGKSFCRSGQAINWWSAFTWCESIGGKVPSFETLCPGVPTVPRDEDNAATCPNFSNVTSCGWSTLGYGTNRAFRPCSNRLQAWDRNDNRNTRAFCEEN